MTGDPNSIDLPAFMAEHRQRAKPDLLRSMLSTFVQALMSAEADAICGAPYGNAARSGPTHVTATGESHWVGWSLHRLETRMDSCRRTPPREADHASVQP